MYHHMRGSWVNIDPFNFGRRLEPLGCDDVLLDPSSQESIVVISVVTTRSMTLRDRVIFVEKLLLESGLLKA